MCVSSHADTLIILPVSVERPLVPQGKAEVSFLTLAATTDANESSRPTDRRTRRQTGGWTVSGGSSVHLVEFHDL